MPSVYRVARVALNASAILLLIKECLEATRMGEVGLGEEFWGPTGEHGEGPYKSYHRVI